MKRSITMHQTVHRKKRVCSRMREVWSKECAAQRHTDPTMIQLMSKFLFKRKLQSMYSCEGSLQTGSGDPGLPQTCWTKPKSHGSLLCCAGVVHGSLPVRCTEFWDSSQPPFKAALCNATVPSGGGDSPVVVWVRVQRACLVLAQVAVHQAIIQTKAEILFFLVVIYCIITKHWGEKKILQIHSKI